MLNTYTEWLIEQHYKAAQHYRVALYKAWQSVVDFPMPVIVSELRMVALPKYDSCTITLPRETMVEIYNKIPKPDWQQIRIDFIKQLTALATDTQQ